MKKLIALAALSLLFINNANAQWCENPDNNFCPGNRFTNGNFESITGNPQARTDQDINLAVGWGSVFTTGLGPSNADIACAGNALCGGTVPVPNLGGVYAGMWIQNSGTAYNATYREQMYNILTSPIAASSGSYTFTCNIAASCQANTANTIDIAVYGVYNPTNALATNTFTSLYAPADNALWTTPGVQVVLLGIITTPAGLNQNWQNVSFTFNSAILPSSGITHIMITRSPTPSATYKKKFIMFDDFCMHSSTPEPDVPTRGCCDKLDMENLIPNGSFESGNTGFNSDYTYQGTIAANSVTMGQYAIANGTEANTISKCWDIVDHTTCTADEGKMMLINGRTNVAGSYATVYQQEKIEVKKGEPYIFCMYYQQLSQCAFDAFDPKNINVVFEGVEEQSIIRSDCPDEGQEDCGWTKISYTIIPSSSTITINVLLNEGAVGDGNDFALDDISLRLKADMPKEFCDFKTQIEYHDEQLYIIATATYSPLPAGFDVTWTVTEVDCSTGLPIPGTEVSFNGDPYMTDFSWYGPFDKNKCYQILRSVTSCCYKDCEHKELIGKIDADAAAKPTGNIMEDNGTSSTLKVYPNPGDGHVTINTQLSMKDAQLTVYSADGKVVMKQQIYDEHNVNIDLSKVPNGVYSFNVSMTDGTSITKTYVKQ